MKSKLKKNEKTFLFFGGIGYVHFTSSESQKRKIKKMAVVILIGALIVYFLPPIISAKRQHNNQASLFLSTLLLGWTGIGWIVCLIWAFSDNVRKA